VLHETFFLSNVEQHTHPHTHKTSIATWILLGMLIMFILFLFIGLSIDDENLNQGGLTTYEDIIPSVVNIICPESGQNFDLDAIGPGGSGVIVSAEGRIYTNAHLFWDETEKQAPLHPEGCFILLPNQDSGYAEEIYIAQPTIIEEVSNNYDLAWLDIYGVYEDEEGPFGFYPRTFPAINEDDNCLDTPIRLGEPVKILGYPDATGGYALTITEGVVSSFSEDNHILTSAKINYGNSGGLAIDANGCLIGIPSAFIEDVVENYGVIIPNELILEFEEQALKALAE